MKPLVLHAFWRSGASYRTRIALNLKGLSYRVAPVDIVRGEQKSPEFLALNPFGLVPALETEDGVIVESPAILEWLEERFPERPLLPPDPAGRAMARAMANIINCDMQPLGNLRVLRQLRSQFGADDAGVRDWIHAWMEPGFTALEKMTKARGGLFSCGDRPGLADCSLTPQMAFARRNGFPLEAYPNLCAIEERLLKLPEVAAAAPELQPDAP